MSDGDDSLPQQDPMPSHSSSSINAACLRDNVTFVLVRPHYLGNIGSVARALKNFGFDHLAFVEPPNNYKDAEARMMAVGAFDVLKSASIYSSLQDAAKDAVVIFGSTSGRQRSQNLLTIQEAAEEASVLSQDNKVIFAFGDEKNGLGNEELSLCHRLVHIPTNPQFPALNLAQSACIVGYELTRNTSFGNPMRSTPPKYTRRELPTLKDEQEFFELTQEFMVNIGFVRDYNKEVITNDLRRLYQRMSPTNRELDLVRGLLFRMRAIKAEQEG